MSGVFAKFPNKGKAPTIKGADGLYLLLESGQKLLDFTSGWSTFSVLGHNDNDVRKAINNQLDKYPHIDGNYWTNPIQEQAADLILSQAPSSLDKVYFSGSNGSDAVEAAMKLSYHVHHDSGHKNKTRYIYRERSYSGSSLQALAVSDIPTFNIFEKIKPTGHIKISEHNYLHNSNKNETEEDYSLRCCKELEKAIEINGAENIAAFIGETITGSFGGEHIPCKNYWKEVQKICNKYNIHLILDEIYCGMGRSGKVYCCSYDDVIPDFICIGKGLSGGYVPMSAVLTKSKFETIIAEGSGRVQIGHTFQGHSLGTAAIVAVQKKVQKKEMLSHIYEMGKLIRDMITANLSDNDFYIQARGRGLNTTFEYNCKNRHSFSLELQRRMIEKHSILIHAKPYGTTFTPAFIISKPQVEKVLSSYCEEFKMLSQEWEN